MKSAYNEKGLYNLMMLKEVKRWWKHDFITKEQYAKICEDYKSPLYHPNFIIRVLLFVATLFALGGVSGVFFLTFGDAGEDGIATAAIFYGIVSFFFLKIVFIDKNHFKSGVTEALLYHAIGFTLGGLAVILDGNAHFMFITCLLVFSFAAYRYLDLVNTCLAFITLAWMIFYELSEAGGILKQIIPFVIILAFAPGYFIFNALRKRPQNGVWENNLLLAESLCLLLVYAAGNYMVVRELSINLMNLDLQEGEDIPFRSMFLGLTIIIPLIYLFAGIRSKDAVLLRVSLIVIGFSVFTFKYYFGFGHPEITLTIAGAVLFATAYALFNYLKQPKKGFTRDNLLSEKWSSANVEGFVVSQTLGGNQMKVEERFKGGGGEFGGGGASGSF